MNFSHLARLAIIVAGGLALMLLVAGVDLLTDPVFYLLSAAMLAWSLAEAFALKQGEPADYAAKRNTRMLQAAVVLAALVGGADHWRLHWTALPSWFVPIGLVVILLGGALRVWSIRTLDAHFRYELRVEAGQKIVDQGPYRLVRHPSYLGLLVLTIGEGLALASPLGALVGGVAVVSMLVLRIRAEERVMRASFGAAYDAYARGTWKLVPYVY